MVMEKYMQALVIVKIPIGIATCVWLESHDGR